MEYMMNGKEKALIMDIIPIPEIPVTANASQPRQQLEKAKMLMSLNLKRPKILAPFELSTASQLVFSERLQKLFALEDCNPNS